MNGEAYLAPQVGFEPTTNRLTADRSTTELLRSVEKLRVYLRSKVATCIIIASEDIGDKVKSRPQWSQLNTSMCL
jgi:hypothetical protein